MLSNLDLQGLALPMCTMPIELLQSNDAQIAQAEQRRMAYGCSRASDWSDVRRPRFCKKCQVCRLMMSECAGLLTWLCICA